MFVADRRVNLTNHQQLNDFLCSPCIVFILKHQSVSYKSLLLIQMIIRLNLAFLALISKATKVKYLIFREKTTNASNSTLPCCHSAYSEKLYKVQTV